MTPPLCVECQQFMVDLLEKRIRRMLTLAHEEPEEESAVGLAQAECFHLMEIISIVSGKLTCGMFDEFGGPQSISIPTIRGPLFDGLEPAGPSNP